VREGGAIDSVRSVEKNLLQLPWQVGVPHQARGRCERAPFHSDLDHVIRVCRPGLPGRCPDAPHGNVGTGQHRRGIARGGGEGQGYRQRVTQRRVGEREARIRRPQYFRPGVVGSGVGPARPVHDGHRGHLIKGDGATACRRMPGGKPQPGLELAKAHHVEWCGQHAARAGEPAQSGIGFALADQREFAVQRGLEPGHVDVGRGSGQHEPGRGIYRERLGQVW
jgi:hypothetical protein